jgi:hypothetical protein
MKGAIFLHKIAYDGHIEILEVLEDRFYVIAHSNPMFFPFKDTKGDQNYRFDSLDPNWFKLFLEWKEKENILEIPSTDLPLYTNLPYKIERFFNLLKE